MSIGQNVGHVVIRSSVDFNHDKAKDQVEAIKLLKLFR